MSANEFRNDILDRLVDAGMGILYAKDLKEIPNDVYINGKLLHRFCDFILLPTLPEFLTPQQIEIINSLRNQSIATDPQFGINRLVRERFIKVIEYINPDSILEIGPNIHPLFLDLKFSPQLVSLADIDSKVVSYLKLNGISCQLFGKEDNLLIESETIDVIIAIFVFQFDFSESQLEEIFRVLSSQKGIVLVNIYKRSDHSKKKLLTVLQKVGFLVNIYRDNNSFCKDHEYWLWYKENLPESFLEDISAQLI